MFDVAEAWAAPSGLDADGDEFAGFFGGGGGGEEGSLEAGVIFDEMIGGEDDHGGAWGASGDPAGGEGDGGRGVAFCGFGDDIFWGDLWAEGADAGFLVGVGEDEDLLWRDEAIEAPDGGFEEGFFGEEGEELFGAGFTTEGPEAFAATAGEDENEERMGMGHLG